MTHQTTTDETTVPYRWVVLCGVWLIYFSFGLTVAALGPLVTPITDDLNMTFGEMGTVLGAWPLIYILAALPCGFLIDRVGPRRGLVIAAVIMGVSGLLRSAAVSHLTLFLAVAIFGLGGPLISIGAPKVIALLFQGKNRGLAMGIYITGPGLGGVIAASTTNSIFLPFFDENWRLVTCAYGFVTLFSGLLWLLLSQNAAGELIKNAVSETTKESIPETFKHLATIPSVQLVLALSIGIFFINHGLNNWLPEIIRAQGLSAANAGYWASIPTAVSVVSALIIPRYATPEKRILILALLIFSSCIATLLLQIAPGPIMLTGLVLQGIARGAMMTVALLLLVEIPNVGPKRAGTAGGLFFTAAEIGGVSGPVAIGLVHDATGGFSSALLTLTVITLALLALLYPLKNAVSRDIRN